jgi:eukaryotic-like serine/threonine-protein kinase
MSPEQSIAHYKIVSKLGEGGMGAVYRATDTKLNRDVAIKVLPPALTNDAAYLARFEREAQVLASLNHPNIAAIYGIEQGAIVMELVEGGDLKGPMDLDQVLPIARQIAAGLAAAHEKGIVHRDLKPANLKITRDGVVKLLDFGLAKATEERSAAASATMSPTMSLAMTQAGVILGTAAYMSPEQARGKPVDRRADIWAFGVVLYELLTGSTLFGGETITDILASVVRHEPELDKVPVQVRRLLRACLQREPNKRLQAIGDWELLLEQPSALAIAPPLKASSRLPWIAAGVLLLGLGLLAAIHFRETPPEAAVVRTSLLFPGTAPPEFTNGLGFPALSPDGKKIVFGAPSADGKNPLWVRNLDSLTAQPLAGTAGARFPFWSPDGRYIAFFADEKLKKIDAAGGAAIALASAPTTSARGGAWGPDGVIVFSPYGSNTARPMERVSASGGAPVEMPKATGRMPWFLPDGKHFLFSILVGSVVEIRVGSLDGSDSKRIGAADTNAIYADGRALFMKDGTLLAQPFNVQTLSLTGEAAPVAEDVITILNTATVGVFTAAANGMLAYRTAVGGGSRTSMQLQWMDRSGKPGDTLGPPSNIAGVTLSPDGARVAIGRGDRNGYTSRERDVWIYDVARGAGTRFTSAPGVNRSAVWSPDGSQIAFTSNRGGSFDLYLKASNGGTGEPPLLKDVAAKYPEDWSPDGKFLLYTVTAPTGDPDQFVLPMTGEHREPRPYLQSQFLEVDGRFSPDGKWVAYTSNESGSSEVYVRPFPDSQGGKTLVSGRGGAGARWRRDGRELFYISADRKMMAVPVLPGRDFKVGPAVELFAMPATDQLYSQIRYDVTADGKRFLVMTQPGGREAGAPVLPTLTLIQNWTAGLKK